MLIAFGIVATFAVVWLVTRVAKRELDKAVAEAAPPDADAAS